jgi:hypothetical protein
MTPALFFSLTQSIHHAHLTPPLKPLRRGARSLTPSSWADYTPLRLHRRLF